MLARCEVLLIQVLSWFILIALQARSVQKFPAGMMFEGPGALIPIERYHFLELVVPMTQEGLSKSSPKEKKSNYHNLQNNTVNGISKEDSYLLF